MTRQKKNLYRVVILTVIIALGGFYLHILYLAAHPQVSEEYKLFYFDKMLATWPRSQDQFSYEWGEEITFGETRDPRLGRGFETARTQGLWTVGTEAVILLQPAETAANQPVKLSLDVERVFLSHIHEQQEVRLQVNGELITTWYLDKPEGTVLSAEVPPTVFGDSRYVTLKFDLPDAHSPAEAGRGKDGRLLALYVRSLTLSQIPG